jgi:hypothetical protein
VLGLGDIGPIRRQAVMEGQGVLFQKFAGIDVFDIEVDEKDPDKLVEIIASLEPTFGGINLEDIKAPECFIVERKLRERMNIPVFHDDQHGTAIIVARPCSTRWRSSARTIGEVKLATSGAGAAGIACLDMLVALGMKPENILAVDRDGVLYTGRGHMDPDKQRTRATPTSARSPTSCRRRRVPRPVRRRRAQAGDGRHHGGQGRSSWRWPIRIRKSSRKTRRRCARTASSPPAVRTTRTRSTTRCASRTSSAARSMSVRPPSTRR